VTLRVGFIGTGFISHENVLGYLDSTDAEIVAVTNPTEAKARDWLARYDLPGAIYYPTAEAMLEAEELDIVEVLSPHHLHVDHVLACADQAAHVRGISLQKPMATSLVDCQAMIDACAASDIVLKVYDNFVFYPVYLRARELVEAGEIGTPISIRVNTLSGKRAGAPMPWPFVPGSWRAELESAGSGPLTGDDGFHKFSLVRWFMQRDIGVLGAWIDADTPLDAPALIRARFRKEGEEATRYGQIDFSFSPEMPMPFDFWIDDFVEIVGEAGVMWINQCSAAGDRKLFAPIAVYRDGRVTTYLDDISPADRNWSTSFVGSTRHFIEVMRDGGAPVYSGEDGMEITSYSLAALVSAVEGRDVDMDRFTPAGEAAGEFAVTTAFMNISEGAPRS
jgi:predicted dehydrogenase